MAQANFDPSGNRFIRGIIGRKVAQLIGRAGFTRQDRKDLEQDLFARVIQSLPKFNPDRAHLNTFVTTVVERYVANVLRNQRAVKRDRRGTTSLNVMIEITDEGPTELVQTIGDRELDARLGRERRSEQELTELAMDLSSVIATLPIAWQALLELRKSKTMAEVAREMGLPRTTLLEWIRRIRQIFEKAGLGDYVSRT
jgi:RNA polymerase sigma-70 factor (ECF subfamily)